MNNLEKLFARIESASFVSGAYAANTLASFVAYIENMSEFSVVAGELIANEETKTAPISDRITALLSVKNDIKYMHQYDAPIAAYLYLIAKISRADFAKFTKSLTLPENTWWSKQMLAILTKGVPQVTTEVNNTSNRSTPHAAMGTNITQQSIQLNVNNKGSI